MTGCRQIGTTFQSESGQGRNTQNTELDCMKMKLITRDSCDSEEIHIKRYLELQKPLYTEIDVFMKLLLKCS